MRIYISGFPGNIGENEIRVLLSKVYQAKLGSIEILKNKHTGESRRIAYIDVVSSDLDEEQVYQLYQKYYNGTKWKGSKLRVEKANPTYLDILQKEWSSVPSPLEDSTSTQCTELISPLSKWKMVKWKGNRTVFEENDSEIVKKSQGNSHLTYSCISSDTAIENVTSEDEVEEEIGEYTNTSDEEQNTGMDHIDLDALNAEVKEFEEREEARERANQRRIEAMKLKFLPTQTGTSSRLPAPCGTKIRFGSDDEDDNFNETKQISSPEPTTVQNWMDSDDNKDMEDDRETVSLKLREFDSEDDMDEDENVFRVRPEFTGEGGKRLFDMQRRYGGDSRFKLDERFVDDEFGSGGENDDTEDTFGDDVIERKYPLGTEMSSSEYHPIYDDDHTPVPQSSELISERNRNLDVLSMLFPDIKRLNENEKQDKNMRKSIRDAGWNATSKFYDPSNPAHKEMEVSKKHRLDEVDEVPSKKSIEEEKREKISLPQVVVNKPAPELPDDRFFEYSSSLNSLFSRVRKNSEDGQAGEAALDGVGGVRSDKDQNFSLSSLFGNEFLSKDLENDANQFENSPMGDELEENSEEAHQDNQSLETHETPQWHFMQGYNDLPEAMTDNETGFDDLENEEDENEISEVSIQKSSKTIDIFLLSESFVRPVGLTSKQIEEEWEAKRKPLTIDFRRKHKQGLQQKKRKVRRTL